MCAVSKSLLQAIFYSLPLLSMGFFLFDDYNHLLIGLAMNAIGFKVANLLHSNQIFE
jgi:hypothetical protein